MRLIHVTEDFVRSGGGLPAVVASHLAWQKRLGWDVSLLHTGISDVLDGGSCALVSCPPSMVGNRWRWSPELSRSFRTLLMGGADLVHLHGIWMAPQAVASRISHQAGCPTVISFHGQLLGGALGSGLSAQAVKKRLYLNLVGKKVALRAQVLHAITKQEAESLRNLFPQSRIEIIPNFIDVADVELQLQACGAQPPVSKKEILYLGRLDARKGVMNLLMAFIDAALPKDWMLHIVGPDDTPGLRGELEDVIRRHGAGDRVKVSGPAYGENKWRLLKGAALVCLPSFHEVIGMVNLEAAICAKPVLTTPHAGLERWEEAGGFLVEPPIRQLSQKLQRIAQMDDSELDGRGASLRSWVIEHYGFDAIQPQWIELYSDIRR